MDQSVFIKCSFMENSIGLKNVNVLHSHKRSSFLQKWQLKCAFKDIRFLRYVSRHRDLNSTKHPKALGANISATSIKILVRNHVVTTLY